MPKPTMEVHNSWHKGCCVVAYWSVKSCLNGHVNISNLKKENVTNCITSLGIRKSRRLTMMRRAGVFSKTFGKSVGNAQWNN